MNDFLAVLIFSFLLNGTTEGQVVISSNLNNPQDGATVTLTCSITGFVTTAFWYNNGNNAILNDCLPDGSCTTLISGRYSYTANASAIMVTITSFSSTQDGFVWKCQHSTFTNTFTFATSVIPKSGDTGLSTGAIVGIVIGAVSCVAGVIVIICLIKKCFFDNSNDVKNKTVDTNKSRNRNPTKKLEDTHAAIHKTPNNANSEAIKPFDQSDRRPLPQGPLPSLLPRNVNQPLDGGQQNFEEPKKKNKKLKNKQKDEGTTEEGKAREG